MNVLNTCYNYTRICPRIHKSILRGLNFKNLKGGAPVDPDSKAMPSAWVVPSLSTLEVLPHTLILIENPECMYKITHRVS